MNCMILALVLFTPNVQPFLICVVQSAVKPAEQQMSSTIENVDPEVLTKEIQAMKESHEKKMKRFKSKQ
jgi:hypothetical protein